MTCLLRADSKQEGPSCSSTHLWTYNWISWRLLSCFLPFTALRSVYKVTPLEKAWFVSMLSKHSSRSSLRASLSSLRLLFESPQSVPSFGGDGSSTPLMFSPEHQRASAISTGGRTDDSNDTREDMSEDSISVCESKDTISIDDSKGIAFKTPDPPDVFKDRTQRDGISGVDKESVARTSESKNNVIILSLETKELCVCGIPLNCLIYYICYICLVINLLFVFYSSGDFCKLYDFDANLI